MSDVAKAGVDQVIDVVDTSTEKALETLVKLENAAKDTAVGVISVGDKVLDAVLDEIDSTRKRLVELLRSAADAVTSALP